MRYGRYTDTSGEKVEWEMEIMGNFIWLEEVNLGLKFYFIGFEF